MNKHSPAISFTLGDQAQSVAADPARRLSEILREDLNLKSVKIGCDAGDCGACTVLVDGEQHCACLTMAGQVAGRRIETVETAGEEVRTQHERLRLRCVCDALVAALYGLEREALRFILADCDHEVEQLARRSFYARLDPKGFWRVDRARPPQLRHSVLSLVAFDALQAALATGEGLDVVAERMVGGRAGEGWQLPATLELASLGLVRQVEGAPHATRCVVREPLGPRWTPAQLEQTPAQAWAALRRHTATLSA